MKRLPDSNNDTYNDIRAWGLSPEDTPVDLKLNRVCKECYITTDKKDGTISFVVLGNHIPLTHEGTVKLLKMCVDVIVRNNLQPTDRY